MDQLGAMVEFFINVLGQSKADAEHNAARQLKLDGLKDWTNINTPDLQTADLELQGDAGISGFNEDANLRRYQMQALDGLSSEVANQGMTPEDALAVNRARQQAGSMDAGFRGAAAQQNAQRGMGSSVGAYAGALGSGQAATNRGADMGMQAGADARQRYMQALDSLSGQASGMRGQEFGQAAQRGAAQDAINRFNTGQRTQNQAYNLGLPQQDFMNQMGLASGRNDAFGSAADFTGRRGDRAERTAAKWGASTRQFIGGAGDSMGGLGGMFGGGQ